MSLVCPDLRHHLTEEFESRSFGVEDAAQIRQIADELAKASQFILAQLVDKWMQGNDELRRLPSELLALCFTFLPLRDRIAVTHVSRYWRSIALAYPAVWADLEFYGELRDEPALLLMALPRAAHHPVNLVCPEHDLGGTVAYCIATHMDHLRTLECSAMGGNIPLTRPAPLLETFCDTYDHIDIPAQFLGGWPGRLRTLLLRSISLPPQCPALSTVTTLSFIMPWHANHVASLDRLFILCPALESLSITDLTRATAHHLPKTSAPRSLSTLYLKSLDGECDLMEHYLTWRTDNLIDLNLAQIHCVRDLASLILGAVELNVGIRHRVHNSSYIGAIGPTGWERAITFHQRDMPEEGVAALILGVRDSLSYVQRMATVPITALSAFLPVLAGALGLVKLTLVVDLDDDLMPDKPRSRSVWDRLALLARVSERCPRLDSLLLAVTCSDSSDPPTAKVAHDMLTKLAGVRNTKLPPVQVEGFAKDSLQDLEIPNFDGFSVEFI